jgi:hypothetical protein
MESQTEKQNRMELFVFTSIPEKIRKSSEFVTVVTGCFKNVGEGNLLPELVSQRDKYITGTKMFTSEK